jgi:parallel beta-helix repeat protein
MSRPEWCHGWVLILILNVCQAADFVVAPNGRDTNPGTEDQPLASLAGARDAVRHKLAAGGSNDITVLFRGGLYPLPAPVVFDWHDSASGNATITYAAWPKEVPVFSGGRLISGWKKTNDSVWIATIPEARNSQWPFRCLYIGDQPRTLARTPNNGNYFRMVGPDPNAPDRSFEFGINDMRIWAKVTEANVVALINWESCSLPIAQVNPESSIVTLTGPLKCPSRRFENGLRYFVENLPEALDAPGEWYLDRLAGLLFYRALPGENPHHLQVVAPRLTQFLTIRGNIPKPLRGLKFKGLHFRHADYLLEPTGHSDGQAAESVPAAVTFAQAEDCSFEQGEISAIGGYAIEVARGCRGIRIEQNELRNLGAGGVKVRGGSKATTIHNNFIHDGGSVFFGGTPILVQNSGENIITHNEVCDFNWMGICVGWSWGFQPTECHNNRIEYNHLHHLGRGVLTDIGAIYTLGISTGTVIRNNLIHHVWDCPEGYLACGIYPDEGSTGLLIESNIVYQTSWGGFHVHYGRDNIIRNNIFALGRSAQIHMGRAKSPDDGANWCDVTNSSMTFERNLILYERGDLYKRNSELWADSNLYWNTAGPVIFQAGMDLAAWQAKGRDLHGAVVDPRFKDADNGDFRLEPDSPAFALGFNPIDIRTVGLVGDSDWVAKPGKIRRPPVVIPPFKPLNQIDNLDEKFETTRLGNPPRQAQVYGANAKAWIRVTDETAAGGKQALKFQDDSSVNNAWDPHLYYTMDVVGGAVKEGFDIRIEKGAVLSHEWRDWSNNPYRVGPSLLINADGSLLANGKLIMVLPQGQWIHVGIEYLLGEQTDGTYTLTLTLPGQAAKTFKHLACNQRLARITWLGFCSLAKDLQVFYLDNLTLSRINNK